MSIEVQVTTLDGRTLQFEIWNEYDRARDTFTLHSHNDQPAVIRYNSDGSIDHQVWFKEGKRHRDNNQPAVISYNSDGNIYCQTWYKEGKCHRDNDQHAYISYYSDGSIFYQEWYKEGKYHRDNDKPAYINYNSSGGIICQRWFKEGKKVTEGQAKQITLKSKNISKGDNKMINKIKQSAQSLYQKIKPYEKYILLAAVLIALDYFIFKGQLSGKIKQLSQRIADKIIQTLDGFINKIGG